MRPRSAEASSADDNTARLPSGLPRGLPIWRDATAGLTHTGCRERLRAVLAGYLGHFRHAQCMGRWHRLLKRFPWLHWSFFCRCSGRTDAWLVFRLGAAAARCLDEQAAHFMRAFPGPTIWLQHGYHWQKRRGVSGRIALPTGRPGRISDARQLEVSSCPWRCARCGSACDATASNDEISSRSVSPPHRVDLNSSRRLS